jgi:hypothetical protein
LLPGRLQLTSTGYTDELITRSMVSNATPVVQVTATFGYTSAIGDGNNTNKMICDNSRVQPKHLSFSFVSLSLAALLFCVLSLFAIFFRVVVRESREGVLGTNEGEFLVDVRDVSGSPVSCAECVSYLPRKRIRHTSRKSQRYTPLELCDMLPSSNKSHQRASHHASRAAQAAAAERHHT